MKASPEAKYDLRSSDGRFGSVVDQDQINILILTLKLWSLRYSSLYTYIYVIEVSNFGKSSLDASVKYKEEIH